MHKALPHNLEIEQAVLGAAMFDAQSLLYVLQNLKAEDFYSQQHAVIYTTLRDLHEEHRPVDLVHVAAKLKGKPEHSTAVDIFNGIPTTAGLKANCDMLNDLASRRRAIAALQESMTELFDPEAKEPLAAVQSRLMTLTRVKANDAVDIGELVDNAYGRAWEAHQAHRNGEVVRAAYVQTGIVPLDDLLVIKRGDMVVLGARPSAGKTSVGLQIAVHIAQEAPLLFFSLEEPASQIADRYLTALTGIGMRKFQEGRTNSEELDKLAEAQASAQYSRLVINDTPGLRVSDMRGIAMRLSMARGHEWGAVMVDHMIKVRPEDGKAVGHQRLTQVSQDLKNMARTLRVPVIVLTQLRRPQDEDKEPAMHELRESGSIEEDADSVLLIHRPERDKSYSVAKFLLLKQRTGPCGSVELVFDAERMRFKQMRSFGVL